MAAGGERLKQWGQGIATIGAGIAGIGASILTPLFAATEAFAESGDEVNKMSQRTGASVEALSELRYAAGQSGASLEDLEAGFRKMAKTVDAAREGSSGAADTFARLGISLDSFPVEPDKQLEVLADALANVQDPGERAALAMEVFGKSGTNLLPLMSDGAKGVRELREEAAQLGLTINQDQADAATNLGDAWDRVKSGLAGATFAIGGALAPALTDLLGIVKEGVIRLGNWVRQNKELFVTIAKVGIVLVGIGGAVIAFGGLIAGAGAVLSGLATVLTTVGTVIGTVVAALLSGPGLLIAALVGAAAYFLFFTETGQASLSSLMDWFWSLFDTAKEAWGGIVNALQSGDLELAGRIAIAGLNALWLQATAGFRSAWIETKFWFVSLWDAGVFELAKIFAGGMTLVESAFVNTTSFLMSTWDSVISSVTQTWLEFQSGLSSWLADLTEALDPSARGAAEAAAFRAGGQDLFKRSQSTGKDSAARQAEIEANRQRRLAEIEAGGPATQAALEQQKQAALAAAAAERERAIASGTGEQDAARAELARLTAEAESGAASRRELDKQKVGASPIATPELGTALATSGTFSAAAAAAMGGGGGPQERLLRTAEQQRKLAEDQKEIALQQLMAAQNLAMGLRHT